MNDKTVLIQIDNLMAECVYSYQDDSGINSGYNCNHLDQEEFETINNKKIGKCYSWSCPLAPQADLQDMKELDQDLYEEYKESADDQGSIDSDWVVLIKEPNDE